MTMHTFRNNLTQFSLLRLASFLGFFCLFGAVLADCECGYSSTINSTTYVFTDVLETDFVHLADIAEDTDWQRQVFNRTAEADRGPFGEASELANIISNPIINNVSYSGPGQVGGDVGLQLFVRGGTPDGALVPVAEIDSVRTDMLWGSYRASMKLTNVPGTCSAFFWYFDDAQEIDMEFLSSQFDVANNSFPVNLVIQSAQSAQQGYVSESSGDFIVANLPFNPTTGFHEYRIDFVPGRVSFYADGHNLATIVSSAVPIQPGHLILTQWSNGNPLWSAGPPESDTVMTVAYVKSYFNSSLSSRQTDFESRCLDPSAAGAICTIPDQTIAPDPDGPDGNITANTYFFSNHYNMTNNQTVYHQNSASLLCNVLWPAYTFIIVMLFLGH